MDKIKAESVIFLAITLNVDYTNYERIEFEIDTIKQEISVNRDYSYNDVSDTESIEFGKDDEDVIRVFNALEQTEIIVSHH